MNLTEVCSSASRLRGPRRKVSIVGYPGKLFSPSRSLTVVLSVLAVHIRTPQQPWNNMPATIIIAIVAEKFKT
jgi:hypothetical protein